jgi:RNAse (barnase) inhibitor barstar
MNVPVVRIPTNEIGGWESFHTVFQRVLGFPDFYGRNMNAWVDCLASADALDDGMVALDVVAWTDVLTLQLEDVDDFAARCPEQYEAVVDCSAFVNWRRIEVGERPILALSFYKSPPAS